LNAVRARIESAAMSDETDAAAGAAGETEDERRRRAAEINRKRAEDQWSRNKKDWKSRNFPDDVPTSGESARSRNEATHNRSMGSP